MAFVGSIVANGFAGLSYDVKPPLIGAAVGAVIGLLTLGRI